MSTTKEQAQSYAADPVPVELTPYDLVQLSYLTREQKNKCAENASKWYAELLREPGNETYKEFYTFWVEENQYYDILLSVIENAINPQNRKK